MASNVTELTYKSPIMVSTFAGGFRRISSPGGMSRGENVGDREGSRWGGGERRYKYMGQP